MSLRASGLVVWALLAGAPALWSQAGVVSGTVRGVGGAPLASRLVSLIGPSGGLSAVTDGNGHYEFLNLDAGTYYAKLNWTFTWPGQVPEPNGVVGELYYKIPCPLNGCSEREGTDIAVPASGTVTIDFDLAPGSRIQGTVTASGGGAVGGLTIEVFDAKGRYVASTSTDGTGAYTVQGIPGGAYFIQTFSLGTRADQVFAGVQCNNNQCDPTTGTPVLVGGGATVGGINFVLSPAGTISGTIRDPASTPVVGAVVEVWQGARRVGVDFATDSAGAYVLDGLAAGSSYRVLARKDGFVTAIYNGASPPAPCPHSGCNPGGTGTAVVVVAGAITGSKDIELSPGHSISGTVSGGGHITVLGPTGLAGEIDSGGSYTLADLPDGSYSVRASRQRGISEYWNNRQCSGAFLCIADPVTIAGANVSGIAFTLDNAGAIRGRITDSANGDRVTGMGVEATWSSTGTAMSGGVSDFDGLYETNREGLPPGTYRVRTVGPTTAPDFADEMWNNAPCEPSCGPGSGNAVTVTGTSTTNGIDFALNRQGVAFYTLTPCRVYDSRIAGGPLAAGVIVPLRAETRCGIPGHAIAISANVTVVSPTGQGSLSIWPFNLPAQPPTSVMNFRAGSTRANNAILGMSLRGFSNLSVVGSVVGGGSYQVIIDVNGYFAPTVSP